MHRKNDEYYEKKVEVLLKEVHEENEHRISLDQKQHLAFARRMEQKSSSTKERLRLKEATMYSDFEQARYANHSFHN